MRINFSTVPTIRKFGYVDRRIEMKEINRISAEVYRERRKHLSCMVHSDLMQLLRQVARQQRWSLSRTTDEILLRGFRATGHLPEEG